MRGVLWLLILAMVWLSSAGLTWSQSTTESVEARRAQLEAELAAEELAIAAETIRLQVKQRDNATLQGEVDVLKSQIAQSEAKIKAKRLEISRLEDQILEQTYTVDTLEQRISRQKDSLAELLRQTRDLDAASLVEILFDTVELSEFFSDVDDFEFIHKALQSSLADIRTAQAAARAEQESLEQSKNAELDAKKVIEREQDLVASREAERSNLLSLGRDQEQVYQSVLNERQIRAAEIRSALFALRDTAAIPFGEALAFAEAASAQTGVRPAFLLAVLKQESNLGENVGTCNRPGDPPAKSWRNIMKPNRDHAPYLQITAALGLNPDTMPLSCPWQGGWGGAMGPAQFIPSTWQLFAGQIAALLGKTVANPWQPADAFMASALYLSDLGASTGGYTAERNAACRYYSGRSCDTKSPPNSFYGNGVMSLAETIQSTMIDPLQNV